MLHQGHTELILCEVVPEPKVATYGLAREQWLMFPNSLSPGEDIDDETSQMTELAEGLADTGDART